MKVTGCVGIVLLSVIAGAQAIEFNSLYTDHRALRVDDVLTIIISEEAKAGSQSGTATQKKNSIGVSGNGGAGALSFIPKMGVSAGNDVQYDGKGGTTRQGSLTGRVTARVEKVLDNGNLVIRGSKTVAINNEKEIIKVAGIVRPEDIEANNIIYSYNIADAEITYSGKGSAEQGQRPGLIARVLNWIF